MTDKTYIAPTDAELNAIYARARRLRAEAMRDAFLGARRAVRSAFAARNAPRAARNPG